ncbi:hypothetical protein CR513_29527, partial [Mucuna pruriens]
MHHLLLLYKEFDTKQRKAKRPALVRGEPLEETPRNKKTNLDECILYVYAFPNKQEGSCVNVASERLVKQLALPTIVHRTSYRLQWLSEKGGLLMDK